MKGQISFVEFIVSFTIFSIFVAYLFFRLSSLMPAYLNEIRKERTRIEAYSISELLVNDPGEPMDWRVPPQGNCPEEWWDTNWKYRTKLIFNNSGQDEDLNSFPVLIKLTTSNFDYSKTKPDGTDIRFIDHDGTLIQWYHIEKWNPQLESFVWLRVPNIPARSNTDCVWMYYGYPTAPDDRREAGTYDLNFVAVYHFNETATPKRVPDSTWLDNYGFLGNGGCAPGVGVCPNWDEGWIGKALKFDANDDYVIVPDENWIDLPNSFTIEAWIYPTGWGENSYGPIVDKQYFPPIGNPMGYMLYIRGSANNDLRVFVNGTYVDTDVDSIRLNEWQYVVATFDRTLPTDQIKLYINGVLSKTGTRTLANSPTIEWLYIGNDNTFSRTFDGKIDEVRISNIGRSEAWIRASYLTMSDNFITVVPPSATGLPKRIGLSDITNKTNFISSDKVIYLNELCQGDGYYDVKASIGTEQDFSLFLKTKPDGNLLLSCNPPQMIYRGINISVKRFVVVDGREADKRLGELIVQMW